MTKKKMSFEDALSRIEEIVHILEEKTVSLEESISLYKEGVDLSILCQQKLSKAEGEILVLKKNLENEMIESPFIEEKENLYGTKTTFE